MTMNYNERIEPDLSGIRWKLTARYVLISGFVLLVFGVAVFAEVSRTRSLLLREQVKQLASSAASQMPLILHEVEEYNLSPGKASVSEAKSLSILDSQSQVLDSKKIIMYDKQLNLLSEYGTMSINIASVLPRNSVDQRQELLIPNGVAYWRPVYLRDTEGSIGELEGYVFSALSTSNADRELIRLRNGLLLGGLLGAFAAAMFSQWMVASSLKPIRDQIQRLVRFSSDASHELRHPLTAIHAVIGSAKEQGYLQQAQPELVQKINLIDQATLEMKSLVDDLLLLTRLDRAMPQQRHWHRFDLCELIEDLIALYHDRASAQQVQLELMLQQPAWVNGNPDQLRRLISNLMVNAIRFSPSCGRVLVTVSEIGQHIQVTIEDQGPGIPIEQRQLIFERFWQADAARSGPNSGLGLSIARSIAEVHGGFIEAQSGDGGGCRMVVQLPTA